MTPRRIAASLDDTVRGFRDKLLARELPPEKTGDPKGIRGVKIRFPDHPFSEPEVEFPKYDWPDAPDPCDHSTDRVVLLSGITGCPCLSSGARRFEVVDLSGPYTLSWYPPFNEWVLYGAGEVTVYDYDGPDCTNLTNTRSSSVLIELQCSGGLYLPYLNVLDPDNLTATLPDAQLYAADAFGPLDTALPNVWQLANCGTSPQSGYGGDATVSMPP